MDGGMATPPRRRPAATTAKTGVARRILKKHLQQKYLLCGFAIHCLLSIPAYLYGIVVENNLEMVMRIWPPILYQSIRQICQSVFLNNTKEYYGKTSEVLHYRRLFIASTVITSAAFAISGSLFSSAWIMVTPTSQIIAFIIYGCFGGFGASLYTTKAHTIIEAIRPREDNYVGKTIELGGEAFCQLFLSFVCTSLKSLYGTSLSIFLIGSLLINLIPISLLITRHIECVFRKRISIITSESRFDALQAFHMQIGGKLASAFVDQMDGIESQPRSWRNPTDASELHCNYMALKGTPSPDDDDMFTTFYNAHGVEIMEIIPEEDENISTMRSSIVTIDNIPTKSAVESMAASQNLTKHPVDVYESSHFGKFQMYSKAAATQMAEKVFTPLWRALFIWKLYPATILQSADIFSYVMCLTLLPHLAVKYHAIKETEIPFLFSLLAFPWMCFALMTPRFGADLVRDKSKWFKSAGFSRAIALLFISYSQSKLLISVSAVLLGFGQAVTMFLQELIIQAEMQRAQWLDIRYPIYLTNGILVLIYGAIAHIIVINLGFQACVLYAGLLYLISVLVWNVFCHYNNKNRIIAGTGPGNVGGGVATPTNKYS